ncbi:MAG: hypothetical protein ACTS45_02060, partial [Candidatus Hodgkinia cicadicola]
MNIKKLRLNLQFIKVTKAYATLTEIINSLAVRPPRPAIDRRLGGHLPRQRANLAQAHSAPK